MRLAALLSPRLQLRQLLPGAAHPQGDATRSAEDYNAPVDLLLIRIGGSPLAAAAFGTISDWTSDLRLRPAVTLERMKKALNLE